MPADVESKLPFQTTYDEYEKFISQIIPSDDTKIPTAESSIPQTPLSTGPSKNTIPNPDSFISHLEAVTYLESRLNYRFLELESKLRFLRFLTAGTKLSSNELASIDLELVQSESKVKELESNVNELKKIGKSLRKKIGKCFHQSEIRRCIEGKPILEDEINEMLQSLSRHREFLESNGLETGYAYDEEALIEWAKQIVGEDLLAVDLLENNLNRIKSEVDELNTVLQGLVETNDTLQVQESDLIDDIEQLEKEKLELAEKLESVTSRQLQDEEKRLIKQSDILNQLIQTWNSF